MVNEETRYACVEPPPVAIVVNNFNYGSFLPHCLRSLEAQTHRPLQVILVDDASTDDSAAQMQAFASKHATTAGFSVNVVEHPENRGQLAACLSGLVASTARFVIFLDADDELMPWAVALHLATHVTRMVALTSTAGWSIDAQRHVLGPVHPPLWLRGEPSRAGEIEPFPVVGPEPVGEVKAYHLKRNGYDLRRFIWYPTSSAMLRTDALRWLELPEGLVSRWNRCADQFLFTLAHLLGGSAVVDAPAYGYRHHGKNRSACPRLLGDTKYASTALARHHAAQRVKLRESILAVWQHNRDRLTDAFTERVFLQLVAATLPPRWRWQQLFVGRGKASRARARAWLQRQPRQRGPEPED